MKVKATKPGFYDNSRVAVGDVFDVPDGASASWYEPEDSEAVEKLIKTATKKKRGRPKKEPAGDPKDVTSSSASPTAEPEPSASD